MSDNAPASPFGWEISARPAGDVLAARARGHGVELMLLARAAGHDPVQIEGWLAELIGVAVETSRNDTADRSVSALLRHVLTGLLFSHAELWLHTPEDPPCSLAFVTSQDRVAFGWAGPAEVELWVDGRPYDGSTIRVRDPDGREAQAIEVEISQRMRVRLAWSTRAGSAAASVRVEAGWAGRKETAGPAAEDPAESTAPVWRVPSWLGQRVPEDDVAGRPAPAAAPVQPRPEAAEVSPPAAEVARPSAEVPPPVAEPSPPPVTIAGPEPPPQPEPIRPMSTAERAAQRAAELAPPEPAVEPPPAGTAHMAPPLPEPAQAAAPPPVGPPSAPVEIPTPPAESPATIVPASSESAPLEIIRGIEAGPRKAPPPGMDFVGSAESVQPAPAPEPPAEPEPIRPMSAAERAAQRAAELAPPEPAHAAPPPPESDPIALQLEPVQGPPAAIAMPAPAPLPIEPAPLPIAMPVPPPMAQPGPAPLPLEPAASEAAPIEIVPTPGAPPPAAEAPLEIIRGMDAGPRVAPPADLDIVREPVPIEPTGLPPVVAPSLSEPGGAAAPGDPVASWASRIAPARSRPPRPRAYVRRLEWPEDTEPARPAWRRHAPLIIGTLVLFSIGWLLGGLSGPRHGEEKGGPIARLLERLGFGPGHVQIAVDSHPQGAWIALDGRDLARRTPATLEAAPGSHTITLSVANLGRATFDVHGERDGHVSLDARLWGSLAITSMDNSVAVKVTVDGSPRGLAPVTVDSLAPGVHQVQFWSPGAGSWDQIVEVRVRETSQLAARPFASPATGVLEVRATRSGGSGIQSVAGAVVWLDGEMRGHTPMRLELARGPHSVRIAYQGQSSPVQVIDLPGGNQRFASFDLDDTVERPQLALLPLGRIDPNRPTLISAALQGLSAGDVREMWLHVSTPEGQWRSYPMNVLKAPGGAAGTVEFPATQLDARGRARYYVSVSTRSGDEFFTEIQNAQSLPGANAASTR